MSIPERWSDDELRACVESYAAMWKAQRAGKMVVKSDHVRDLLSGPLHRRSRGSVEYRFANVSAVMDEAEQPFLSGYVPAKNVGPTNSAKLRAYLVEQGLLPQ